MCRARSEAHREAASLPAGGGEPRQGMGCPTRCSRLGGGISPPQEETAALGRAPVGAVNWGKQKRASREEAGFTGSVQQAIPGRSLAGDTWWEGAWMEMLCRKRRVPKVNSDDSLYNLEAKTSS